MSVKSPRAINIEATKTAISKIKALDLRFTTIEKIKELLTDVLYGHTVSAPRFETGVNLFRLQIRDKPTHVSGLSYPPPHLTPLGRVNRPGSPVFYCCTSREATFFEIKPTKGQTVVISQWITTGTMMVNHIGYTEPTFKALGSKRPHAGWGYKPTFIPGDDANWFIAEFLSEAFTRRVAAGSEHEYKLTIAIGEKLFSHDLFDGLLYPSIAFGANADNFALKNQYADNNLRFVKAEYAKIEAVEDNFFEINISDTATKLEVDDRIIWKGRRDQWVIRPRERFKVAVENGKWVVKNASGKIVDPE
jgi:hypothetical protein